MTDGYILYVTQSSFDTTYSRKVSFIMIKKVMIIIDYVSVFVKCFESNS